MSKLLKQLSPELRLVQYHQIPVLELNHHLGQAKIALQGAQLLSWQPTNSKKDLLWLSEIEPFEAGKAIRGGIPICYPWFGSQQQPAHGTARIRLWHLTEYQLTTQKVRLVFHLFDQHQLPEATLEMQFQQDCQLKFTHYGEQPAQLALHSYFNIANIDQIAVQGLPTQCYNALNKQQESVPSPRRIDQFVDCIYRITQPETTIIDENWQRQIQLKHHNASNVVLWNPYQSTPANMTENGYKTMVCLETARIDRLLQQGESVTLNIQVITQ